MGYLIHDDAQGKSSYTIKGVVSNPAAARAEHPILLIHLIHSAQVPAARSQLRLHGVISMHHRDPGADECQRGCSRPTTAPLLHQITIMSCSTRFHSGLTRSTAEMVFYCLVPHLIICLRFGVVVVCFIFASPWLQERVLWMEAVKSLAAQGAVSNHNLLYNKV